MPKYKIRLLCWGWRIYLLYADAEAELEALCVDTVRRCWTLGLDISGLGAHQALRDGHFALTTKNVCPEIRADVKLIKF